MKGYLYYFYTWENRDGSGEHFYKTKQKSD